MNTSIHSSGAKAGFSLTELMVSVAIVSVLAGTGALDFASMIPEMRDDRATKEVISLVRQVRLDAVSRNARAEWWMETGALNWWVDADRDGVQESGEVSSVALDERGTYDMYPDRATFDSRGEIVPDYYPGAVIWSYQKTKVSVLTVSANGHVREHGTATVN